MNLTTTLAFLFPSSSLNPSRLTHRLTKRLEQVKISEIDAQKEVEWANAKLAYFRKERQILIEVLKREKLE